MFYERESFFLLDQQKLAYQKAKKPVIEVAKIPQPRNFIPAKCYYFAVHSEPRNFLSAKLSNLKVKPHLVKKDLKINKGSPCIKHPRVLQ